MKTKIAPVKEEKKTLEQLEKERDILEIALKEYLMILGADYLLLDDIIRDLKSQMCVHADPQINDMIADLINLENKILYAREEEKANSQNQPH